MLNWIVLGVLAYSKVELVEHNSNQPHQIILGTF